MKICPAIAATTLAFPVILVFWRNSATLNVPSLAAGEIDTIPPVEDHSIDSFTALYRFW